MNSRIAEIIDKLRSIKTDMSFIENDAHCGEIVKSYLALREEYEKLVKELRAVSRETDVTVVREAFTMHGFNVQVSTRTMVTYKPSSLLGNYKRLTIDYADVLLKVVNGALKHLSSLGQIDEKNLDKDVSKITVIKGL